MELRELHELDATDPEDWGLIDYSQQAARLLEGFYGVQEIRRIRLAFGVARVIGLFLAEVVSRHGKEDTVWVIVGDLPPSASPYREDETPRVALELYAESLEEWADAVDAGDDTSDLLQVLYQDGTRMVEETPENADLARRRAHLIRTVILPEVG
jgi:ketosteroid isomerase-like protein